MKVKIMLATILVSSGFLAGWPPTDVLAQQAASDIPYQQDGAKTTTMTFQDVRGDRFCEIFFIQAKGDKLELNVYNSTGLNNMVARKNSCPDELLNKVNFEGLKTQYKLDGIYFNKPRY